MAQSPIRIRRYPNRRYYATHSSSYVSLAEIEQLVSSGHDIEIVDSQTGEDITRSVLLQMITERHPEKIALIPSAMLHAMIRANTAMSGFLQDYFVNSLSYLDFLYRHGPSEAIATPVHWMKAWLESLSKHATAEVQEPVAESPAEDVAQRMRQLEERIAMLEKERGEAK